MSRRKPDIHERQKQIRNQECLRSPLLKEKYPQVADIIVEMIFKNPDSGGNPKLEPMEYSQESKAFFKIECPYRECVSGGFNFSFDIDKLVTSRLDKLDGTITCQGWQDKERINKHGCYLELNYTISAKYKKNS